MSLFDRCRSAAPFSAIAIAISLALASPLAFARGGPFKEIDELRQQLDALSATLASKIPPRAVAPVEVPVNCAAGDTIAEVLDEHRYSPAPLTIHVSGVCHETAVVLRSNVTIRAAEPGAGVYSEDPLYGAITTGNGANGIIVEGLHLSGGAHGVLASRNSQVEVIGVEVTGTGTGLVAVDGSLMDVASSTVHNNSTGIGVLRNGTVTIAGTLIDNNTSGIYATTGGLLNVRNMDGRGAVIGDVIIRNYTVGAILDLGGNALIRNASFENGTVGVLVRMQSSVQLIESSIRDNVSAGVAGERNTSIHFQGNNDIRNNGVGISCSDSTVAMGWPGIVEDNVHADIVGCIGL